MCLYIIIFSSKVNVAFKAELNPSLCYKVCIAFQHIMTDLPVKWSPAALCCRCSSWSSSFSWSSSWIFSVCFYALATMMSFWCIRSGVTSSWHWAMLSMYSELPWRLTGRGKWFFFFALSWLYTGRFSFEYLRENSDQSLGNCHSSSYFALTFDFRMNGISQIKTMLLEFHSLEKKFPSY